MNENKKFKYARQSIIAGFGRDEETGLTPLEFLDTFEDVNELSLKSVLPLTYNAIRKCIEANAHHELDEGDYSSSFCVVRLSNDSDCWGEVFCVYHTNLKCALSVYATRLSEIENGKGYHCSMWQIKLKKENAEHTSVTIECVGEHSNWKPIVDSLAKVKKLDVSIILKGYDMYLAGQV